MTSPYALHLLATALAGWLNRHQQVIIDYLIEEYRIFKQQLGGHRFVCPTTLRRRLAAKGKALGRQVLAEVANLVTPDTILAWHRGRFRRYWASISQSRRPGRPAIDRELRNLIRIMQCANPCWGAPRIHGELLKLGIEISQSTVSKYMIRGRKPPSQTWRTFLSNHAGEIAAIDFFTVATATFRVLYVLLVLEHDRRHIVHFIVPAHPTGAWIAH